MEDAGWRVATSLPEGRGRAGGRRAYGFGLYRAPDYDALIDHPVEMGRFSLAEFDACGVPHAVAITGRHDCDLGRLVEDLKPICEAQIRLFGEPAPMDRYVFLVMAVGDGYGGLEHRASTALLCSRADLPHVGLDAPSEGYRQFLGLCSHEYFHTWNVKRIKPAAFVPYDLSRENYTRLLWAFEGFTSYYDDLMLVRSGRISVADYLGCSARPSPRCTRAAAVASRAWPSRPSRRGPSITVRTRTAPTPSSATTPRVPWWPCSWICACAWRAGAPAVSTT
jgi:predicted metalloprotease with PDZ domain